MSLFFTTFQYNILRCLGLHHQIQRIDIIVSFIALTLLATQIGATCNVEHQMSCVQAVVDDRLNWLPSGGECVSKPYVQFTHLCSVNNYLPSVDYCCCVIERRQALCCRYHQNWNHFRCVDNEDAVGGSASDNGTHFMDRLAMLEIPMEAFLPALLSLIGLMICCTTCCVKICRCSGIDKEDNALITPSAATTTPTRHHITGMDSDSDCLGEKSPINNNRWKLGDAWQARGAIRGVAWASGKNDKQQIKQYSSCVEVSRKDPRQIASSLISPSRHEKLQKSLITEDPEKNIAGRHFYVFATQGDTTNDEYIIGDQHSCKNDSSTGRTIPSAPAYNEIIHGEQQHPDVTHWARYYGDDIEKHDSHADDVIDSSAASSLTQGKQGLDLTGCIVNSDPPAYSTRPVDTTKQITYERLCVCSNLQEVSCNPYDNLHTVSEYDNVHPPVLTYTTTPVVLQAGGSYNTLPGSVSRPGVTVNPSLDLTSSYYSCYAVSPRPDIAIATNRQLPTYFRYVGRGTGNGGGHNGRSSER